MFYLIIAAGMNKTHDFMPINKYMLENGKCSRIW